MPEISKKIIINFKKANSLLAKVIAMQENKEYCINIMQQNLAVIGLLRSAHQQLLDKHLKTCFTNAMAAKNEKLKQRMIDEIIQVNKLNK